MTITRGTRSRWICGVLVIAACSGDPSATAPDSTVDRKYVTGEAAAALNSDGEIVLPERQVTDGSEIDEVRAVKLASAFMHDYGAAGLYQYEEDRGASIQFSALATCARAFYAASTYRYPAGTLSEYGQSVLGAQWLVSFCNPSGVPIISIALSARATDLTIQPDPDELPYTGSYFFSAGIPVRVASVPPMPERAIEAVAQLTGKRVSKIPELVLASVPFSPQLARWHVTIESAVNIRGVTTGTLERTDELYYGFGDTWNTIGLQRGIAADDSAEQFYDVVNGSIVQVAVFRKPGTPAAFEPAVIEGP